MLMPSLIWAFTAPLCNTYEKRMCWLIHWNEFCGALYILDGTSCSFNMYTQLSMLKLAVLVSVLASLSFTICVCEQCSLCRSEWHLQALSKSALTYYTIRTNILHAGLCCFSQLWRLFITGQIRRRGRVHRAGISFSYETTRTENIFAGEWTNNEWNKVRQKYLSLTWKLGL